MKLIMIIARLRPRRVKKVERIELDRNWSLRDWADLPAHHPRQN
ncbi:MAG: hypothetical protein ABIQ30_03155 [Devosia sp.]